MADAMWADVLVGLLLISNVTDWQPLEYPFTSKIGGRLRHIDPDTHGVFYTWLYNISASIADITQDISGGVAAGQGNDTLDILGRVTPF